MLLGLGDRHRLAVRRRRPDDEPELDLGVEPGAGPVERTALRPEDLPARPADRRAADDDGARAAVVADRHPLPVGRQRVTVGAQHAPAVLGVVARGEEVDVVGDVERQDRLRIGGRGDAGAIVEPGDRRCQLGTRARAERHQLVQDRLAQRLRDLGSDVERARVERGDEVDDVVVDPRAQARRLRRAARAQRRVAADFARHPVEDATGCRAESSRHE